MKVNHHTRKFKRERDTIKERVMREGGLCAIPSAGCPGFFDFSLPWLHPWAFTIHHLMPTSLGGARDHPSNMVPAHRRCNEVLGNRVEPSPRARGGPGDAYESALSIADVDPRNLEEDADDEETEYE